MSVPTLSSLNATKGDAVGVGRSPQQQPEFRDHGVAIALQKKMTKPECLERKIQTDKATISHW